MAAATAEKKDIKWLTAHVAETLGSEVDQIKVRQVLRKLAIEKTEGRYSFKGVNDPNVKAVVREFKEQAKAPAAPRGRKAAADAPKPAARKTRAKKVAEPVEEEDELEDELDLD